MKHPYLSVTFSMFFLATAMAFAQQEVRAEPPRLVLPTNSVELGRISGYEIRTNTFRIANSGGAPLNIKSIVSTCSCISGKASPTVIQPKAEGLITLRLDANLVHGVFKRAVWVETDDPEKPRVMITLTGESMPLFDGVPPLPIALRAADLGTAWTNEITVTVTETNFFLGTPEITDREFAHVAVTVKTNAAPLMSYAITTIITPTGPDLRKVTVTFPVTGRAGTEPRPLSLYYQIRIGAELRAIPQYIQLTPAGKAYQTRLMIRTTDNSANPEHLRWAPELEGVDISQLPHNGRSNITLMVKVAEGAAPRLLESKAGLTFTYPGHKPLTIPFVTGTREKPAAAAERKLPSQRFR